MFRRFHDRTEAGRTLALALRHYRAVGGPVVVVALPRGGVPVAHEVARALGVPLDVCVIRKLGVPGQEELAMGAIAGAGGIVMNQHVVRALRIPPHVIDRVAAVERRELERRERLYRGDRPGVNVAGARVIVVDDGVATGATMRAAVATMRRAGASSVVVAIPVAPEEVCRQLAEEADDVVCLMKPDPFEAIGLWYEQFPQVDDATVGRLLSEQHRAPAPAS